MATTCAHVNMPAVCADKAWHYVLLSLSLSARSTQGSAQTQDTYLHICTEFGGHTLGWSSDLPMTSHLCEVKGAQTRVKETLRGSPISG